MRDFVEALYYHPKSYQYLIILFFSPLSLLYGTAMFLRRILAKQKDFGLPVVSVGNLIVGGSGKTPFVIALATRYESVAVISRGYGRKSKGLLEVSRNGKVLVSVEQSGDEAMLMARSLPHASVIVCENRKEGIDFAKEKGAKVIILDDGFNRVDIKKFEILLEPGYMPNILPFPAGPFREFFFVKRYADIVFREGKDFKRIVETDTLDTPALLVTAIANPKRLEPYLPKGVVGRYYLEDHAYFDEKILEKKMREAGAGSLLVTQKDAVKMAGFKLPIVEMRLKLEIDREKMAKIDRYIKKYEDCINEE